MTRRLPPEVIAQAAALLDDGASLRETSRTVGASTRAIARYLPGRSSWTSADGGRLGQLRRHGGIL